MADQVSVVEDQGLGWGKSLPVPSVQEIVRRDPLCVPERYMRDGIEAPSEEALAASLDIPVIDLSLLSSGHAGERKRLDAACRDWGFFLITNHGVSQEVINKTKAAMSGFFELSIEEKKKYSMAENDLQGYGQAYKASEEEKLDWCDMIFLVTVPTKFKKIKYWPTVVSGFRDAIEEYSAEIDRVTKELLTNLSLLMNVEKDVLLRLHGELKQGVRLAYYPTCYRPGEVLGIGPHSDATSITLLLQDDGIEALQIRHNSMWVPVRPTPYTIVANVGDCLEAWSNGMYKSIEHRAITNKLAARMSLATFTMPDDDMEIGPLDHMVDEDQRPKMYKTVKFGDYVRHFVAEKQDGKAHTHFLKLES